MPTGDPFKLADTRSWMAKSHTDLRSARHALKAKPPLAEDAVFHSQQAVEKALKAFLSWHDKPFRKTHSLEELGEQCIQIAPFFKELVGEFVHLTEYAWKFRYPGEPESPTLSESKEAILTAEKVFKVIEKELSGLMNRHR